MVYVGVSRVAEEECGRRLLIKTVVSNGGMLSFVTVVSLNGARYRARRLRPSRVKNSNPKKYQLDREIISTSDWRATK